MQALSDQATGRGCAAPSVLANGSHQSRAVDPLAEGQAEVVTLGPGEGTGLKVEADPFGVTNLPGMDLCAVPGVRPQALELRTQARGQLWGTGPARRCPVAENVDSARLVELVNARHPLATRKR